MGERPELHALLVNLVTDIDPEGKVYFQEPQSRLMEYPCIVYKRTDIAVRFADNNPYSHKKKYMLTVMDKSPDSLITEALKFFPMCAYDRFYVVDNLNHDVFMLYF
jgi:hypothetical protein